MTPLGKALVLLGAAMVVGALWAPWYSVDISQLRGAIDESAAFSQLPQGLGAFAQQMLSYLPDSLEANAWEVFEGKDAMLLVAGAAAAFAALMERRDLAGLAAVGAGAVVTAALLDPPGPAEVLNVGWGLYLAMAGVAVMGVGAALSVRTQPRPGYVLPPSPTVVPAADAAGSVAPPGV